MDTSPVLVYSLSTCGTCRDTINFLAQNGVDFTFTDIDLLEKPERKEALENLKKKNPDCTFPTTVTENGIVIGYDEEKFREVLGL